MDEPRKHHAEGQEPDKKATQFMNPINRKCPERANPQRQEAD